MTYFIKDRKGFKDISVLEGLLEIPHILLERESEVTDWMIDLFLAHFINAPIIRKKG